MPKTTITHESWCENHSNDGDGREVCQSSDMGFGPMVEPPEDSGFEPIQAGSFFMYQAAGNEWPTIMFEYYPYSGYLTVAELGVIHEALQAAPAEFTQVVAQVVEATTPEVVNAQ